MSGTSCSECVYFAKEECKSTNDFHSFQTTSLFDEKNLHAKQRSSEMQNNSIFVLLTVISIRAFQPSSNQMENPPYFHFKIICITSISSENVIYYEKKTHKQNMDESMNFVSKQNMENQQVRA